MTSPERDISAVLETLDVTGWTGPVHTNMAGDAVTALEDGKVLYFPRLAFALSTDEHRFLDPAVADAKAKNISLDPASGALKHAVAAADDRPKMQTMLQRYCEHATALVRLLLPPYANALEIGRTSFRPAEIAGRRLSTTKDDTRLHIDAFPSTPMGGKRILRVFTNVNPDGRGRDWRLGASFEEVARTFADRASRYSAFGAKLMHIAGATKDHRTAYDHAMLAIHDTMKQDEEYQRRVTRNAFSFPPGSTWIAYTDRVSHAAMGGQHLLEQTFYLPVSAMADAAKSPLRILERTMGRPLL
jgi:hypothetical protein